MLQADGALSVLEGEGSVAHQKESFANARIEPDLVRSKFKKFVKEFMYSAPGAGSVNIGTLKYRDQFQQNIDAGFYKLEVNLTDLNAHEDFEVQVLAYCLETNPTEYVPLCEAALQELYVEFAQKDVEAEAPPRIQLQFCVDVDLDGTFGTMRPMKIREMISTQVEKLVVIQGIVVSVKSARNKARSVVLKCSNCENVKTVKVAGGYSAGHIPGGRRRLKQEELPSTMLRP
eukprot:NODE_16811_length_976_cov_2.164900.p1 GENE.NODE_16811_length_976_cov_2.164900~~NODE_16811_length_976_cov_2.164900.p1  ORF type:complete len:231 (+),score=88.03 NODE_16811_length_976_cov_2.164900:112-804(+)